MSGMLEGFVERVSDLREVPAFERFMADELEQFGFDRFAYLVLRVPNMDTAPFVVTTYPEAWVARYTEREYLNHDPVLCRAMRGLEPFDWLQVEREDALSNRQTLIMREASEHTLCHGASVPVHAPNGGFAILSVTTKENGKEFQRIWQTRRTQIHMMGLYYHSAIERKLLRPRPLGRTHLTDREREALLWTARGKTAWEASEIMRISQDTVNFHLKNVMQKLGVYSKHHAVVNAIMNGLILP